MSPVTTINITRDRGGPKSFCCSSLTCRCAHHLDIAPNRPVPSRLALAPNSRQPRLLVPRQSRWAVVMRYLHEPGRGYVIAPSVEIEEARVSTIAQALVILPSRV